MIFLQRFSSLLSTQPLTYLSTFKNLSNFQFLDLILDCQVCIPTFPCHSHNLKTKYDLEDCHSYEDANQIQLGAEEVERH